MSLLNVREYELFKFEYTRAISGNAIGIRSALDMADVDFDSHDNPDL